MDAAQRRIVARAQSDGWRLGPPSALREFPVLQTTAPRAARGRTGATRGFPAPRSTTTSSAGSTLGGHRAADLLEQFRG